MTDNIQAIPASYENGQAELVEAIIELNNMGDDWDAQHIGELVADWHNKQVGAVLDRLVHHFNVLRVEHYNVNVDLEIVLEKLEAERNKLKENTDE